MGEVDAAFAEGSRETTELASVIAGNTLENRGEVGAIFLAQQIKSGSYGSFCLAGNSQ